LPRFEECLQQLEHVVDQLERGDLPLEQALKLFEEGMKLSLSCRQELEQAEGRVEILLKQNGKLQAQPFDTPSERTGRGE
jgi:exodeoxyribonuclease VII small subunit